MGARLTCSCAQTAGWPTDDSTLRVDAELFELSPDGQRWQRMDPRLVKVRVYNSLDECQPRIVATTQSGHALLDTLIPFGEKIHKVSDYFVYFRSDGRTLGLNTLSGRDTSLLMAHACNTTHFNMFQHSFSATVARIATFENDVVLGCDEQQETTNVSLNPLNMVFNYRGSQVSIDLLESFASSGGREDCVEIAQGVNVFRVFVSSHAHVFLVQALNISSLLLARTTSPTVAISYLVHQQEKVVQRIESAVDEPAEQIDMLLLKKVVVQQRLNALRQTPLPDYQWIEGEISAEARQKALESSPLSTLFLYFFNMYSFRLWRKSMEVRVHDLKSLSTVPSTSSSTSSANQASNLTSSTTTTTSAPLMTTFQPTMTPTTTFQTFPGSNSSRAPTSVDSATASAPSLSEACEHRRRQIAIENGAELATTSAVDKLVALQLDGEDYQVRKSNGRLGLTIYAHNDGGVIRAEVRGVTSFAPRCAAVGDVVVGVDGELIASVRNASDVERLLRQGRVIHLRRRRPLVNGVQSHDKSKSLDRRPGGKLTLALQELLLTEKKYVQDLKEMNDLFLCIRVVREIMTSSLPLLKIQTAFVESLEEAIGDVIKQEVSAAQMRDSVTRVCAVFVNRCADFKVYAEYASSYLRLQQELKHNKDLLAKLEAVNRSKEQHCSYESRMIKPVQRIVQYPLLLKNILDAWDKDVFERKQVESALQKMQTLAEYVNEMQRLHEEYAELIEAVKKAYEPMLVEKGVRIDTRDLLIFAHIRWIDAPCDRYVVFVFQTVILLLPSYARKDLKMKWTRLLPVNEVEVEELHGDAVNLRLVHAAFESPSGQLSHSNPNTVYHIECCQEQLKQQLIKSIKKARANFARESRRPLSGSSQSDGGYVSEVSKEHIRNGIKN